MLEELSKKDKDWRLIALKICGDKSLADDLVNDMYLKLCYSKKQIDTSYVFRILYNLFIDHKRKERFDLSIDDYDFKQSEDETLENRYKLLDILNDVSFFEKEVLLITHEYSLREAAKKYDVPWYVFRYHKGKALKKLKEKYGK